MKKAWIPLAALPLLTCLLQAASSAVSELPLPEKLHSGLDAILRSAVQQSPRMVNQALELEAAENDRIAARSNLLPTLSAGISYYQANDAYDNIDTTGKGSPESLQITKTPYSITFSQPLFHWGERKNNNSIGKIRHKIAQGQYREGYRLLVQELRSSYLRLIVQKMALKRSRYYQQYVDKQLKLQEERLQKKVISEVEISIARLNSEQAQLALERSELGYDSAKKSFARLAGLSVLTDDTIPDSVTESAYTAAPYDQLLAEFLSQKDPVSNAAFNLRQQIDISNLTYANAKTRLLPKANFVIGLNQDEQTNLFGVGSRYSVASTYAGVAVNWTIFDGFAAGAAKRNALIRRRQQENDYHQLTEQLAQNAQTAVKQINFAARVMGINNRQLTSSVGYFKTVSEDFRRGVKSESEVGQVQLNVYDAEINAANARADFLVQIGDFLGTLNEDPIVANLPVQ